MIITDAELQEISRTADLVTEYGDPIPVDPDDVQRLLAYIGQLRLDQQRHIALIRQQADEIKALKYPPAEATATPSRNEENK